MKNLNFVAEQLFNQIRGRFPNITIGDTQGNITNEPQLARFFDFDYENEGKKLGKVSVSLDENDGIIVMYSKNFIENSFGTERANWFTFLKDMRMFSKKRLLNFEVRDINRSNLTKRDYKFLATNRTGDGTMNESMLYGKHRVSYQNIDNARLVIKHNENIDPDIPGSRTRNIKAIYVESPEGERFRYPYRHLSGARAMARHVSEGGHAYDDFGKYISSLSEELSKLRKFKTYMGRSSVMAESLSGYMDAVKDRISTVRKTIESLQKPTAYKEAFETFEAAVYEDVPDDVAENWIDQLTIKQFNEELKDVFPYIYRLVSEVTKAKEIGPDELIKENDALPQDFIYTVKPGDTVYAIAQKLNIDVEDIIEINGLDDNALIKVGQQLRLPDNPDSDEWRPHPTFGHRDQPGHPENKGLGEAGKLKGGAKDPCWSGYQMVGTKKKGGREVPNCVPREEIELESGFDKMMGQFGEADNDQTFSKQGTMAALKGLKAWEVSIGNNYYSGRYADWGFRPYPVLATSADEAKQVVLDNADAILKDLLSKKSQNGKRLLPPRSALPIEAKHIGRIEDGTVKGRRSTLDYKTFFSPQGPMTVKLENGNIVDIQESQNKGNVGEAEWAGDDFVKAYDQKQRKKKALSRLSRESEPLQLEKPKTPLGEFILSYFDRNTGQFPKGETAVLTMIEKDYGDQFIEPAKAFIERINNLVAEKFGFRETDLDVGESGLQYYTGKKKYGKEGMAALAQAGRNGASEEELGRIKDKYKKESEDIIRLSGLR